jgi:polyisoprenoid-binding protein YceI
MTETQAKTPATRELDGVQIPAPGTFAIDASHSRIGFVAKHLVVAKVRGQFDEFEGSLTFAEDALASTAEVTIKAASINTNDKGRDEHLRSGDFLLVEENPNLTFRTTSLASKGKGEFALSGELTMRGVTKPVVLDVELDGVVVDPWGNDRVLLTATTEIDREEFGVSWNAALETGGVMVGKKIKIELEVQAVRQA